MKARPAFPEIKALTQKINFGKYKNHTIEEIIELEPGYLLYLHDEKIAKISKEILDFADEADIERQWDEAVDGELDGMRFWDIYNDD